MSLKFCEQLYSCRIAPNILKTMGKADENESGVTESTKVEDALDKISLEENKALGEKSEAIAEKTTTGGAETTSAEAEPKSVSGEPTCSYCSKPNPTKRCTKRHPKCLKKMFCR